MSEERLAKVEANVAVLREEIALRSSIAQMQERVDALVTELNRALAVLDARLKALEPEVDAPSE